MLRGDGESHQDDSNDEGSAEDASDNDEKLESYCISDALCGMIKDSRSEHPEPSGSKNKKNKEGNKKKQNIGQWPVRFFRFALTSL